MTYTPTAYVKDGVCFPFRAEWRRVHPLCLANPNGNAPMLMFFDAPGAEAHLDALVAGSRFCAIQQNKGTATVHTIAGTGSMASIDVTWIGANSEVLNAARSFPFPENDADLLPLTLAALS